MEGKKEKILEKQLVCKACPYSECHAKFRVCFALGLQQNTWFLVHAFTYANCQHNVFIRVNLGINDMRLKL